MPTYEYECEHCGHRFERMQPMSAPPVKKCPQCGKKVEVFSNDLKVTCDNCGFVIYNDIISCVQWCKYAKECVGEEMYRKLVGKKEG